MIKHVGMIRQMSIQIIVPACSFHVTSRSSIALILLRLELLLGVVGVLARHEREDDDKECLVCFAVLEHVSDCVRALLA